MMPPSTISTTACPLHAAPPLPTARERPILFSAPMVRALLDGSKTQTRRIMKPQPAPNHPHDGGTVWVQQDGLHVPVGSVGHLTVREKQGLRCPYGLPGERLWVRETHAKIIGQSGGWIETDYRATYTHGDRLGDSLGIRKKWTPSIHMPRDASRIDLEVTGVRVERLRDITPADAIAEGIELKLKADRSFAVYDEVCRFAALWQSAYGPGSWWINPWVWIVEFRRLPR